MKALLFNGLDVMLGTEGFTRDGEWDGVRRWKRPHPSIGFSVLGISTFTKYAPDFFQVGLSVGFRAPVAENAIKAVCGPDIVMGEKQKHIFASEPLLRAYCDPERPKKKPPFPPRYTFWNVDFHESVVEEIKDTIQRYAMPFFDRIKTAGDLRTIGMSTENRAALFVWLGDVESALRLLDEDLQKQKRYGPEMRARLERLRKSIESGDLQRLLSPAATSSPASTPKPTPPASSTTP